MGFTTKTAAGRARAEHLLEEPACRDLQELTARKPQVYFLTVPDQALPAVADALAEALANSGRATDTRNHEDRPVVVHTSGANSVALLASCERAGADGLAFHPLQTFSDPATGRARFAGAAVALTPYDGNPNSHAGLMGFRLARALGLRPFLLPDEKRTLYHAAATVACNYLVTLQHYAKRLFVESGLPEAEALSLFLPLVEATLDNLSRQGTVGALTGPLSRGDVHTIEKHLNTIEEHSPDVLPLYRTLGLATLALVEARGDVPAEVTRRLAQLLQSESKPGVPGT